MMIQTGMRTDIPAFFSEWFCNRLKEGYVYTRNPFNPKLVTEYQLNPEVVDLIGFCTKNPGPMIPHLDLLKPYGQYWFVTITPYGKDIEPNVPDKHQVINDFQTISKVVGKECMGWRYDPIILNDRYTKEYHLRAFETIASALDGHTDTCVISFVQFYQKLAKNYPEVQEVSVEDQIDLGKQLVEIAKAHHMTLKPCFNGKQLGQFGADIQGCMTRSTYEDALHAKLIIPKEKAKRDGCTCILGNDIGQYNTCMHFCRYCYANYDREIVRQNMLKHDPASPLLIGHLEGDDILHTAKQVSWKEKQLSLF